MYTLWKNKLMVTVQKNEKIIQVDLRRFVFYSLSFARNLLALITDVLKIIGVLRTQAV